jgi:tocopherol cyclase
MLVKKKLRSLFNPPIYQGWGKRHSYFEGWYFKVVDRQETSAFALIPGVAMDAGGNRHSFIQVLDGKKKTARYHKFDYESFVPDAGTFRVAVGNNIFSEQAVSLDLDDLKGELSFSGNIPWPNSWHSPGIMGPYSFVPFMECYHGIVSMDNTISGTLVHGGRNIDFGGGRGYIEKDWGTSFPDAYIWIQSNHFDKPGISVKISVARIPWLNGSFIGFIAGIWLDGRLVRFTTYNKSRLRKVTADSASVEIVMENSRYLLEVIVARDSATELASPITGFMDGRIEESMSSSVKVRLTDRKNGSIYAGEGRNAAVEVAGKVKEIFI